MARAVWSGVISFGLVSVPVEMFTATKEHELSFHQFVEGSTDRIRYKRVDERTGNEIDYRDIVKGVDVGGGNYVMVTDEELEQIAPGRSRALEITSFADLDDIDPIYFNKTYYLAPAGPEAKKTYALLRDAMAQANRAAVATLVMHGKEHLAAIRPSGNTLLLETLFFADEVRDPQKTLEHLPGKTNFSKGELAMATQLITAMDEPWKPDRYRDTYTDRVNDLIEAKRQGHEVQQAEEPPQASVIDLFEALQRSVDLTRGPATAINAGRGRGAKRSAKQAPAKNQAAKAPAKKQAAKAPAKKQAAKAPAKKQAAKAPAKKTSTQEVAASRAPAKKASRSTNRIARKAS